MLDNVTDPMLKNLPFSQASSLALSFDTELERIFEVDLV